MRLYGRYIRASLRGQMQYPASFILTSLGAFVATGVDFIATWALFARFHQVAGWRFGEVALFYAVIGVSFALADGSSS
jgi:ABC-2 type transport system permease protein